MAKLLAAFFLSLLALTSLAANLASSDSVYICTGSYAHTYHTDRSCSGLVECGQVVRKIHRSKVPKKRRLCKLCANAAQNSSKTLQKSQKAKSVKKSKKASKKKKSLKSRKYPMRDPLSDPFASDYLPDRDPLDVPCD